MAVLTATMVNDLIGDQQVLNSFFEQPQCSRNVSSIKTAAHLSTARSLPSNTDVSEPYESASNELGVSDPQINLASASEMPRTSKEHQCIDLRQVDPNHDRRKRRRTSSPHSEKADDTVERGLEVDNPVAGNKHMHSSFPSRGSSTGSLSVTEPALTGVSVYCDPGACVARDQQTQQPSKDVLSTCPGLPLALQLNDGKPFSAEVLAHDVEPIKNAESTVRKPKKFMQFNPKTGTIGSPPTKKPINSSEESSKKISPGKRLKKMKSLIVKVQYGQDELSRTCLGEKINQLLQRPAVLTSTTPSAAQLLPEVAQSLRRTKETHPFFLGRMVPKESTPTILSASGETPLGTVKPMISSALKTNGIEESHSMAEEAKEATLRNNRATSQAPIASSRTVKFPGAVYPAWPPRGMTHIRGDDVYVASSYSHIDRQEQTSERKSKYVSMEAHAEEDVLRAVAQRLDIGKAYDDLRRIDTDAFTAPEQCLRLPRKHFETGKAMQRRIRGEVSSYLPFSESANSLDTSEDELSYQGQRQGRTHPAIKKAYGSLATSLTAFDQSRYETQSWVHKHSPSTAMDVLQVSREPFILKDWLQALKIISTHTGTSGNTSSQTTSTMSKRLMTAKDDQMKRKRKPKLEGFVVSDDEERHDMDEISEHEDSSPRGSQGVKKKTVIRAGDGISTDGKLANTVVISGPNGCGKTAMVYAVAKELGFEVFEINSSCRRNGKDVLERVGDMTRNHLVQRAQPYDTTTTGEDSSTHTDALAADLANGRQGTMDSFFKTKTTKSKSQLAKKHATIADQKKKIKAPAKHQKQSLILFEEVDILYDEDKQFWTTVMGLIVQSKRPVIMTCNDEALVPLQGLSLHAIIRLSPPPVDLAADYLLLVAANEGHVLKRNAVVALYQASNNDLRASMTELEFWCQIGVGDRKGGLDWFYPRWPVGSDVDENGDTIRVVSEGTYKKGMGWLGRDSQQELSSQTEMEEDALHEAWHGWHIDACDAHDIYRSSLITNTSNNTEHTGYAELSNYETLTETLSAADVCACGSFGVEDEVLLDASAPPMLPKSRDDFIIGYELLQADTLVSYDSLGMDINFWLKAQARELWREPGAKRCPRSTEAYIVDKIIKASQEDKNAIRRRDFSLAFDPIAEPDRNSIHPTSSLECSVFDRTMNIISVDVAPYVRSIVAYDARLQQERVKLSNLLSQGGRSGKRMRTTRSAFSALEGGARNMTRREKYFGPAVNTQLVLKTGSPCWQEAAISEASYLPVESAPTTPSDIADSNANI